MVSCTEAALMLEDRSDNELRSLSASSTQMREIYPLAKPRRSSEPRTTPRVCDHLS
jgi:hypothetical protein